MAAACLSSPTVALHVTVVPSTTVLSAVCRGGTRPSCGRGGVQQDQASPRRHLGERTTRSLLGLLGAGQAHRATMQEGEPPHGIHAHIDKSVWLCYSFFVHVYREREKGLGGSTEGKRPDVGARLRCRPGRTPRALAPRAETRAATLRRHARAEKPSMRVWVRMTRRTCARTTILDARACGLPKVQRCSRCQSREALWLRDERIV